MNGKKQAIEKIECFLKSDEKGVLITGTHQYEKHKLVIQVIEKNYKNASVLFRTNSMSNIENRNFLGWCGINKTPKAGEKVKIGSNFYQFDSFTTRSTWYKTKNQFDIAILYPLDSAYKGKLNDILENLFVEKNISKVFLASWTDLKDYDYSKLSSYFASNIVYDALEDDKDYHNRVVDFCEKN